MAVGCLVSDFFSYFGWLRIVLLGVTLMSGIFSLFREVVLMRHPEKVGHAHLFWRCLFITYIICSFWLWCGEHSLLLAEHKKHEAQLDFTFHGEGTASVTTDPNSSVIFFIAGTIANSGEMPSIVRDWTLDIDLPDGTRISPKLMLFSNKFADVSGETAQHMSGDKFDLARDYLPDIASRTAVTSGAGLPGFIMFTENLPASRFNGVVLNYMLCYEDINHHRSCSKQTAAPGLDVPLGPFLGMHR
jgi:hypothetical protein